MAVNKLPLITDQKNFVIRFVLNNNPFRFRFYYNIRDTYWYVDINDEENNPIRSGIKILNNNLLLGRLVDQPRPDGEFIFVPKNFANDDPTEDGLETDADWLFYELADIQALLS